MFFKYFFIYFCYFWAKKGKKGKTMRVPYTPAQVKMRRFLTSWGFELAIAEGANLVRLGTAIFGPRD